MMHINSRFKLGDIVTMACSEDDAKGMVVCVCASISGSVSYSVSWGDRSETGHHGPELALVATSDNDFVRHQ